MNIILIIFLSLLAGWVVNVVADVLPTRRPLRDTWLTPLCLLPTSWQHYLGIDGITAIQTDDGHNPSIRRYRLVFGAAVALGLLATTHTTQPLVLLVLAIQAWFFLTIAVIDLEHRLVLNRMLLFGLPFVLLGNMFTGIPNLASAVLGGVAGFGFFLVLALLAPGAMGMGDVKLAGFIGLITGLSGVMMTLFLGIIAGGIAGVIVLIRNRFRRGSTIAYAPYLVLGVWFFLFDLIDTLHIYLERL